MSYAPKIISTVLLIGGFICILKASSLWDKRHSTPGYLADEGRCEFWLSRIGAALWIIGGGLGVED